MQNANSTQLKFSSLKSTVQRFCFCELWPMQAPQLSKQAFKFQISCKGQRLQQHTELASHDGSECLLTLRTSQNTPQLTVVDGDGDKRKVFTFPHHRPPHHPIDLYP